jgi:hypothetical protein
MSTLSINDSDIEHVNNEHRNHFMGLLPGLNIRTHYGTPATYVRHYDGVAHPSTNCGQVYLSFIPPFIVARQAR